MPDPTQPKTGDEIMATVAIKDGKVVMLPPDAVALTRETREQVRQWVPQRQLREYDRLVNWLQAYEAALTAAEQRAEQLSQDLERERREHGHTLDERDTFHEWADKLAAEIAGSDVIGEHSSANNPWREAIEALDEERHAIAAARVADIQRADQAEQERDTLRAALEQVTEKLTDEVLSQAEDAFGEVYVHARGTVEECRKEAIPAMRAVILAALKPEDR